MAGLQIIEKLPEIIQKGKKEAEDFSDVYEQLFQQYVVDLVISSITNIMREHIQSCTMKSMKSH